MFSDVWGENAVLFERLAEIHSNPPILYYGFKVPKYIFAEFCVSVLLAQHLYFSTLLPNDKMKTVDSKGLICSI